MRSHNLTSMHAGTVSWCLLLIALLLPCCCRAAQPVEHGQWRAATEKELEQALPARAPVQKERIETEMRTASGVIDDRGRIFAGVVLITAGYSADGKYSHYLMVGSPIRLGTVQLPAGKYVFGWKRIADGLDTAFYDAATGAERGHAVAKQLPAGTRVEAFRITPPGDHAVLQVGRFGIPYAIE